MKLSNEELIDAILKTFDLIGKVDVDDARHKILLQHFKDLVSAHSERAYSGGIFGVVSNSPCAYVPENRT